MLNVARQAEFAIDILVLCARRQNSDWLTMRMVTRQAVTNEPGRLNL